ncbi:hypothetical protein [Sodalis sp.]|uniref:hypothetical protein n=1 Tax=Sodalis sp. (in: enterobacteria) TaxID=1898979 RepID=UPI003872E360
MGYTTAAGSDSNAVHSEHYLIYLLQLPHSDSGPSFKYKDYSINDRPSSTRDIFVVVWVAADIMVALK